jgi:hypothetical protein
LVDGWWWGVASAGHAIEEGTADTEAAARQEADDAACKANLLLEPPTEIDPEVQHIIGTVAEACEGGRIASAYRSDTGGAKRLKRSEWRQPHVRNFFDAGIPVLRPVLDEKGRPVFRPVLDANRHPVFDKEGRPVLEKEKIRCTREVFVRQQDLTRFVKTLRPVAKKRPVKSRVSDSDLKKIVRDYDSSRPAGTNPSMPAAEAFARDKANLVGHRTRFREIYNEYYGITRRGRPSKGKKK